MTRNKLINISTILITAGTIAVAGFFIGATVHTLESSVDAMSMPARHDGTYVRHDTSYVQHDSSYYREKMDNAFTLDVQLNSATCLTALELANIRVELQTLNSNLSLIYTQIKQNGY